MCFKQNLEYRHVILDPFSLSCCYLTSVTHHPVVITKHLYMGRSGLVLQRSYYLKHWSHCYSASFLVNCPLACSINSSFDSEVETWNNNRKKTAWVQHTNINRAVNVCAVCYTYFKFNLQGEERVICRNTRITRDTMIKDKLLFIRDQR